MQAIDVLKKYGSHIPGEGCIDHSGCSECHCGFDRALAELAKQPDLEAENKWLEEELRLCKMKYETASENNARIIKERDKSQTENNQLRQILRKEFAYEYRKDVKNGTV